MSMCEDFPCCGHERGCCPDFDESGRQLNMKCTCGAAVPVNAHSSICSSCLAEDNEWDDFIADEDDDEDIPDDDDCFFVEDTQFETSDFYDY